MLNLDRGLGWQSEGRGRQRHCGYALSGLVSYRPSHC